MPMYIIFATLFQKGPNENSRIRVRLTSMTTVQGINWSGDEDQIDGDCTKDKLTVYLYGTDVDVIPYVFNSPSNLGIGSQCFFKLNF